MASAVVPEHHASREKEGGRPGNGEETRNSRCLRECASGSGPVAVMHTAPAASIPRSLRRPTVDANPLWVPGSQLAAHQPKHGREAGDEDTDGFPSRVLDAGWGR